MISPHNDGYRIMIRFINVAMSLLLLINGVIKIFLGFLASQFEWDDVIASQ